jgi:uncharacterized membrane protein YtjA (UPF0391 family)
VLRWGLTFLFLALIGAVAGFTATIDAAAYVGHAAFILGVVLFVVSMVGGGVRNRPPL